ncbi:MAG: hypothetical protein HQL57_03115 [Magnetococcales bacterium]|nr:hypothetical protein [Magnetococcales bacterium]MBF0156160.1 hypothetical protein [Magnetococcales bacterium]
MLSLNVIREAVGNRRQESDDRRAGVRSEGSSGEAVVSESRGGERRRRERRRSRWLRLSHAAMVFVLLFGGVGFGVYRMLDWVGFFQFI